MNICIITAAFLPELSGVSTHLSDILYHYSNMGHHVLVLCPDYSLEEKIFPGYSKWQGEIYNNISVRPIPSRRNPVRPERIDFQNNTFWDLEDYIGGFSPEIIHVEEPERIYGVSFFGFGYEFAYNDAIGIEYANKNNIPVIAFYHTNYPIIADICIPGEIPTLYRIKPKEVYKKIFGGYTKILCSCEDAKAHLEAHDLKNIKDGIFMGINERIFSCSLKSELIPENDKIKLLYCGMFDDGKDVKKVIDIFKEVYTANCNIQLYLAGNGMEEKLRYVHYECNKNKDIKYIGMLEQSELAKVYNSVDMYISPHEMDTFGLAIVEAMSKGLSVITMKKGGPTSIIEDGYNGLLCSSMDMFVSVISALAENKNLREKLGNNAREYAKKYYGQRCAINLLEEYKNIIKLHTL